ncbi:MAG: CHC2 zinc finger domain-containing protein [Verrucomicrobiota bacterium]
MPRIPDEEIDRVKKSVDLPALIRARGIELKPHGNGHLIGFCPFHDDKGNPNMVVTPSKGLFHCMCCGAAGNGIQFVQKFDGISFRHAFDLLDEGGQAAFNARESGKPVGRSIIKRLENPLNSEATDPELFDQVIDYYAERLPKNPAAIEYLEKRGLNHPEAIAHFRIGVADRSIGLRLPHRQTVEGGKLRDRLQSLGVYRKTGREHFNGCIVLPVLDPQGSISEVYGRRISKPNPGASKHLYLPGPHAGIWNKEALQSDDLILCEAPLDALTFWVNGLKNVTFIYGTQGFPDYLETALIEHKTKRVFLAYDADKSGDKAAERDASRLAAKGIEVYRVKFPRGMDANEYATKVTPAPKSLAQAVKSAEWLCPAKRSEDGVAGSNAPTPAPSSLAAIAAKKEILPAEGADTSPAPQAQDSAPETNPVTSCQCAPAHKSCLKKLGEYHSFELGQRRYRIGGLEKNNSLDVLRISLRIRHGEDMHTDALDLLKDADRRRFIERTAEETRLDRELIKRDLGKLLLALEEAQESRILGGSEPSRSEVKAMTGPERSEAMELLQAPDLVERVQNLFDDCGLVGEQTNRLAAYLACTSRKLDRPLAVIIQSTSAAGKSTLMEAVLAMFPEEDRVKYSAMTGQSLYYLGETNLKNKILAIVEEEGAEKASYALKLLQSERELTIASTGKDATTGRMETQEYHVEGPVTIFLTTTAIDIDEELQNRCLTLSVDESKEQTARIHQLQRESRTLEGLRRKKRKDEVLNLLRNAQRLLEPMQVINDWSEQLTFTSEQTRTRRDHEKYLGLIEAITLLHQHQRPLQKDDEAGEYIPTTLEDIELANKIAPELLARSLDELPPQSRRVLDEIKALVRERCEAEELEPRTCFFSRREIRERLGWGITQIRAHLERLRELEYVSARYGRQGSSYQYELLIDPNEKPGIDRIHLLDVNKLRIRSQPVGVLKDLSGGCRPPSRQVQPVEQECFKDNLSGCSDRTSGTQSKGIVVVGD